MEKEPQPESITTIPMKPDYPPSEIYSSEPPPAYHRSQPAAVQVAKIIAVTIVLVSVVLGGFLLASAYVTANASCRQLEQELQLLSETADRLQSPLQPEALIQEEPKEAIENNQIDDSPKNTKESDNSESNSDSSETNESDEDEKVTPIHIKLPLQLNLDELTGALGGKNQKAKMNCIVEKKRAEEVVDHQSKTVRLPFGVNLTTEPRFERITGERMVIICESGSLDSRPPLQVQPEEQEETVMIQPVVIPIGPINPFQTHMPQQMRPVDGQQQMSIPHPMETLRPPMPGPLMQQQPQQSSPQASQIPPNIFLQHIAQQIIEQRIRNQIQRSQEEAKRAQEARQEPQGDFEERQIPAGVVMTQRLPIPEEILRQINRLPNHEVIVSVQEQEADEVPQTMRLIQQQRQNAREMNGRQSYAREIPVHIPVPMMHQMEQQQQQQQPEQEIKNEEMRPHYVQPRSVRSVRSVDALLQNSEKRVKRCACDCAC